MDMNKKELILDDVDDLVSEFLYYDRKNYHVLMVYVINEAIHSGVITVEEIVEKFKVCLMEGIK